MLKYVVIIPIAASAIIFLVAYFRYRSTPEAVWKRRLMMRHQQVFHQLEKTTRWTGQAPKNNDKLVSSISQHYRDHLTTQTPVEALCEYPSIGPKTVLSLKMAGYHDLSDFIRKGTHTLKEIANIRDVRSQVIEDALRQLIAKVDYNFKNGNFPEAGEMVRRIEQAHRDLQTSLNKADEEIVGLRIILNKLQPLLDKARNIGFFQNLFRPADDGANQDLLETILP